MPRTIIILSSLLLVLLTYSGLTEATRKAFTKKRLDEEPVIAGSGSGKLPFSDDEDFGAESGSGSGSGQGEIDSETDVVTTAKGISPTLESTTTSTRMPLSPCERMRQSSLMMGQKFIPNCIDHVYGSTQCAGQPGETDCWCSDKIGKSIPGTIMEPPNIPDCDFGSNLSPCLFQLVTTMRSELLGSPKPQCTKDGQYHPVQCTGSVCYCVNKDTGATDSNTIVHRPDMPSCETDDKEGSNSLPIPIEPGSSEEEDDTIKLEPDFETPDIVLPNSESTDSDDNINLDRDLGKDLDTKEDYNVHKTGDDEDDSDENRIDQGVDDKVKNDRLHDKKETKMDTANPIMAQPGLLAGIIGGSVVLALCLVLLIMFIIYRMRKKDEGSYPLDEPRKPPKYPYMRAPEREFYA